MQESLFLTWAAFMRTYVIMAPPCLHCPWGVVQRAGTSARGPQRRVHQCACGEGRRCAPVQWRELTALGAAASADGKLRTGAGHGLLDLEARPHWHADRDEVRLQVGTTETRCRACILGICFDVRLGMCSDVRLGVLLDISSELR